MVGNRREALLWDLQAGKIDEQVKPVPVKVEPKEILKSAKEIALEIETFDLTRWVQKKFPKVQN